MLTLLQNNSASKEATLSDRLSAIAESLPRDCVVCDVGSDHGALPLYLLCRGLCKKAIVTDLNEKPLARARQNLAEADVDDKATFVLTDGIEAVLDLCPDAFVIAGMGGETILGILQRGLPNVPVGTRFVLQPMTKTPVLRRFLYENGFFIDDEKVVYENDKYFVIISAIYDGVLRSDKVCFAEFGEYLQTKRNKITKAYFSTLLQTLEKVISGKKSAGVPFETQLESKNKLLKILEDLDENQRD